MRSIEFETVIKNGKIILPDEYKNEFSGPVRVILITKEDHHRNIIEELIEHPLEIPDFHPLSREEIYSK